MTEYTDIIETENRTKKRENCESEIIRNNGKDRGDKMMEYMEMVEKLREKANMRKQKQFWKRITGICWMR